MINSRWSVPQETFRRSEIGAIRIILINCYFKIIVIKFCCNPSDGSRSNFADYIGDADYTDDAEYNKLNLQRSNSPSHANNNDDQGEYIAPNKDEPSHIPSLHFTNTEEIADDKLIEAWQNIIENDIACQLLDELFKADETYIQRQINAIRRTDSLQLLANNKASKVC